jgi:hypothetical protein
LSPAERRVSKGKLLKKMSLVSSTFVILSLRLK